MPLNWKDALTTLGVGITGMSPETSSASGSGTSETNQMSQGNQNTFSNEVLTTWLSNLMNALTESQGQTTNSYNLDPSTKALIEKLTGQYASLANPFDSASYQATQTQGINRAADLQKQAIQNIMASRGVSGPAAATAEAQIEGQRIGNIVNMQQQVPFLANQFNTGNLNAATSFLSAIPKSTTTTNQQSTSQQQSQNTQGNNVSSSTGGTTYYNDSWNKNTRDQQEQKKTGSSGFMNLLGTGIGVLGSLFSDETLKKEVEEFPHKKAVDQLMKLRPATWKWTKDDSSDMGVIAQDLQKTHPELVHKDPEGSGKLKVNYAGLISELVAGLQAVNTKVEALR